METTKITIISNITWTRRNVGITIDKDKIQKKLVNLTWTKTDTFMILILSPLNFQSSMIKKYSQGNDLKNFVYQKTYRC